MTTGQADPAAGSGGGPTEDVSVRRDGVALTVTLNRPERLNAVTREVLEALADRLQEAAQDADLRVVVVTGAGRAFSSGADLAAAGGQFGPASPPGVETIIAANRVVRTLRSMPQPVIAAVNGPAAGVGCSIALGCDLVVAVEEAYFLLAFINIGLMPDGGATALVPVNIGRARAMQMALLGERLPAATALDWGLIYKVVPTGELDAAVAELVRRFAAGAPQAAAATKRAVNAATLDQLDLALDREQDGQAALLATADFFEAVSAFATKRRPTFTGR
jgi:enoyl-CoA hydratase